MNLLIFTWLPVDVLSKSIIMHRVWDLTVKLLDGKKLIPGIINGRFGTTTNTQLRERIGGHFKFLVCHDGDVEIFSLMAWLIVVFVVVAATHLEKIDLTMAYLRRPTGATRSQVTSKNIPFFFIEKKVC